MNIFLPVIKVSEVNGQGNPDRFADHRGALRINDGSYHAVDSSDIAFQLASIGAFKEGFSKANPVIKEPIMKVAVEGPTEFQGSIMGSINQRRGVIVGTFEEGNYTVVEAEVPLAEMFGYSTVLRSLTQGKAEFSMEFSSYKQVPKGVSDGLIKAYQRRKEKLIDCGSP